MMSGVAYDKMALFGLIYVWFLSKIALFNAVKNPPKPTKIQKNTCNLSKCVYNKPTCNSTVYDISILIVSF